MSILTVGPGKKIWRGDFFMGLRYPGMGLPLDTFQIFKTTTTTTKIMSSSTKK